MGEGGWERSTGEKGDLCNSICITLNNKKLRKKKLKLKSIENHIEIETL